jgi:lipopolysaccharide transport system ATP-binding protein
MTSEIAIRLDNISKCYQIYDKPQDRFKQLVYPWLQRIVGKPLKAYHRKFSALKDISFEVKKGETVGIIGRNGAGKSTLLQIICGTLTPTSGNIQVNGRVAALLELGAGFNYEFTGKENVYLNAQILGLTSKEIEDCYSEIIDFADIGEFIDKPVKTYSSGMFVRLAFSVIVHVKPDILIVDEALAVGDIYFQAKCMHRLKKMMASGVTVLFVSHDTATVRALCQKCLYLERGNQIEFNSTREVVDTYIGGEHLRRNNLYLDVDLEASNQLPLEDRVSVENNAYKLILEKNDIKVSQTMEAIWPSAINRYGDGRAKIIDICILDASRREVVELELEQDFIIQIAVRFLVNMQTYSIGYTLRDLKGQMLVGLMSTSEKIIFPEVGANETHVLEIHTNNRLMAGVYSLSIGLEYPVEPNLSHIFLDVIEHAKIIKSVWSQDESKWFPGMVKVPAIFQQIVLKDSDSK